MDKGLPSMLNNIDDLPLAIKKFMKIEYLVFYEEGKQNEAEVEALRSNLRKSQFSSIMPLGNEYKYRIPQDLDDLDYEDIDEEDEDYYNDDYGNEGPDKELYDEIFEHINADIQREINEDMANRDYMDERRWTTNKNALRGDLEDRYIENEEDFVTDDEEADWEDEEES